MRVPHATDFWRNRRQLLFLASGCIAGVVVGAVAMMLVTQSATVPAGQRAEYAGQREHEHDEGELGEHEGETRYVELPRAQWEAAKLRIEPAKRETATRHKWVTGKLTLNEDRTAHIYPLVEGRAHHMYVSLGEDVKQGQVLAVIDSREVGEAKLALVQYRLESEIARANHEWDEKINQNTQELIKSLEQGTALAELEPTFHGKPMGQYRQQLLTTYASLHKSRLDYERLAPLAETGAAAGKQALAAKAAFEADQATFRATLEQLKFTAWQQALQSQQALEKAQTQQRVSQARLLILGYHEEDLQQIDPISEGEDISHYPVKASFDGTIISKDVVIDERVGPDRRMFQLADLSTLWVQADIYQQDLPELEELGETLRFRGDWLDHEHEAKIFYSGDVLDAETRTIRLRAVVDNPDRHLKPGMFVEVDVPTGTSDRVITVPVSAIQEIGEDSVVFVHTGGDNFEQRNVILDNRNGDRVEIREGLQPGDPVVVAGAFILKSEMMRSQLAEGGHHH